jgi:glycosyltransferase involved in cell wall biosynthesis
LELIIVDDASKDDSAEVLQGLARKDKRVKVIVHEQNHGPSRSRNDGLRAAVGEFVGFCDADDLWKPEKLARQIRLLEERPDCDITYCDSEIIDETGRPTGELFSDHFPVPLLPSGNLFEVLCARNFINTQTVLARRLPLDGALIFDEHLRLVEDWWQWIRLARRHLFLYEPAALALYRVHSRSTGLTQKRGFSKSRCKVAIMALRAYTDLPLRIQGGFWYLIGWQLCYLGKRRRGCRFILKSLSLSWAGRLPLRSLARMSARLALEWTRYAIPPLR